MNTTCEPIEFFTKDALRVVLDLAWQKYYKDDGTGVNRCSLAVIEDLYKELPEDLHMPAITFLLNS